MEVSLKGLREALYLMQEGGKMEVYIPSELGYGEKGVEGLIHEGAVLIYELELVEVGKPESVSAGITIDGVSLEGAEFLEEKKGEKGVVTLPSGLM
jgi:FKBP-type peptidyl-prolyl cis-trans isomerase